MQKTKNMTLKGKNDESKELFEKLDIHSIDIWAFGMILIEIIYGYPIWLNNKGKIEKIDGKNYMR